MQLDAYSCFFGSLPAAWSERHSQGTRFCPVAARLAATGQFHMTTVHGTSVSSALWRIFHASVKYKVFEGSLVPPSAETSPVALRQLVPQMVNTRPPESPWRTA
jgi:hypothetical protein